jgi:hypothetical protein
LITFAGGANIQLDGHSDIDRCTDQAIKQKIILETPA